MSRRTRKGSLAALTVAGMLLAAPAANARLDEGNSTASAGPAIVQVEESGGFSWGDAAIGAGAAFGAVLVAGGAGRLVRRHGLPAHP
jgi:hypothetical protein